MSHLYKSRMMFLIFVSPTVSLQNALNLTESINENHNVNLFILTSITTPADLKKSPSTISALTILSSGMTSSNLPNLEARSGTKPGGEH